MEGNYRAKVKYLPFRQIEGQQGSNVLNLKIEINFDEGLNLSAAVSQPIDGVQTIRVLIPAAKIILPEGSLSQP